MWGANVELMILNQRGAAENPARQSGEGKSKGVLKGEPAATPQTGGGNAADVDRVVSDSDGVAEGEIGLQGPTSAKPRQMWGTICDDHGDSSWLASLEER